MTSKRNLGYALLPLLFAVGICVGIFIGLFLGGNKRLSPAQEKLRSIFGLIESEYVDEVNTDSLLEASFGTLMLSLDPHSAYIAAKDLNATNAEIDGNFEGVGVSFQILNDSVTIVEVIEGGPAEKVGLLPGDRIVSANGNALSGVGATNEDVFSTLRGKKGTKVEMVIKRTNSHKPVTYTVTRDEIPVNSVTAQYIAEPGVGYIKLSQFTRNSYMEFLEALGNLKGQGARKYIIDLRDNGGGLLDQAILMANEFLPAGRPIVFTKGRLKEYDMQSSSDGTGSFQDAEIVVLTNEYSASASEIFAGAIQDNDRGLVIGRRTFGKGLVQNQTELSDGSAIRLTVARYYTPSGRSIQKIYKRGEERQYESDIADRYNRGEFFYKDSIKLDTTKKFLTVGGRTVYGGGGIMPDIFVPQDTLGITSYYINVNNQGLIQRYALDFVDKYRSRYKSAKTVDALEKILPDDDTLLQSFVDFAAANGVPARWYYINESRDLIVRNVKAMIVRDLLGYNAMNKVLNEEDPTVVRALNALKSGKSPTQIRK